MTNNIHSSQKDIRKEKRLKRKSLSFLEKQKHSHSIAMRVCASDAFSCAQRIGAYLCMPEEVNVQEIIEYAWNHGKDIFLPVVSERGAPLLFAPYTSDMPLKKDCLGIDIPDVSEHDFISASELDVVITPLVAFDEQCNRIGMGGGFYDRTFAFKKSCVVNNPILLGVAFETQRVNGSIEANEWDIRPDGIITETKQYSYTS